MNKYFLGLLLLGLSGCQNPVLVFAGGSLEGEMGETDSWIFAKEYKLMQLETRPDNPYSVYLRVTVIDDDLYLDAAPRRRWHQHIQQDNRVRIKIGDFIYRARTVLVSDPAIISSFLPGRTIYRIEPAGQW